MKKLVLLLGLAVALAIPPALATPPAAPEGNAAQSANPQFRRIEAQLHPVHGDIRIPGANAVLHLGEDYYYLPAAEARMIITEGWGNPPELASNVIGIVFPTGQRFYDDTWGAVITYDPSGYVSDSDAASVNYDELLTTLRGDEQAINARRAQQGFPATHLVGWAQQPVYDARTHSVVWAQNIQFAGQADNSLNYDVRLLGRRGVLSLNMVTSMSKLAETREAARLFSGAAEFNQGERYADYRDGDHVAEYGIAGLIAAGVGVAVVKKAGLIALILAFGKKAIILIIAGFALLGNWFRKLFRGRRDDEEAVYYEEAHGSAPTAADIVAARDAEQPPPTG
jgi:uncharacterized membrane-anchored protein